MGSWGRRAAVVAVAVAVLALGACGDDDAASDPADTTAPDPTTTAAPVTPTEIPDSTLPGDAAALGPASTVPVNGVELGYRQFGEGDPLVLITGQTATMSLWPTSLLLALAEDHQVTMLDNRGVGYSTDDPETELTIPLMGDDTAGLIEALDLAPADVVGWSTGGEIALAMAVDHPDVMAGAVVVAGMPGGPDQTLPPQAVIDLLADPNAPPTQVLALLYPDDASDASADYVEQITAIPQEEISPDIIRRQAAAEDAWAQDSRVADALADVDLPMLVVAGAEDEAVPVANSELIAERVPDSRLELLDGAGHAVMFQLEDDFVALVDDFLG